MENEEGNHVVMSFKELVGLGVNHFRKLFQKLVGSNIAKIIKVASYFPRLVSEEDSRAIYEEIT